MRPRLRSRPVAVAVNTARLDRHDGLRPAPRAATSPSTRRAPGHARRPEHRPLVRVKDQELTVGALQQEECIAAREELAAAPAQRGRGTSPHRGEDPAVADRAPDGHQRRPEAHELVRATAGDRPAHSANASRSSGRTRGSTCAGVPGRHRGDRSWAVARSSCRPSSTVPADQDPAGRRPVAKCVGMPHADAVGGFAGAHRTSVEERVKRVAMSSAARRYPASSGRRPTVNTARSAAAMTYAL